MRRRCGHKLRCFLAPAGQINPRCGHNIDAIRPACDYNMSVSWGGLPACSLHAAIFRPSYQLFCCWLPLQHPRGRLWPAYWIGPSECGMLALLRHIKSAFPVEGCQPAALIRPCSLESVTKNCSSFHVIFHYPYIIPILIYPMIL